MLWNENTKCIIIVVINVYSIGINNLDIKLVIQYNISLLFDLIIQKIRRISKKDKNFIFIFFIPM